MTLVGVYGSLREGFHNNKMMNNPILKETKTLTGYKMYSFGFYPAIRKSDNEKDTIYVEVYDVNDNDLEFINSMELGAGYHIDESEGFILYVYNRDLDEKIRVGDGVWK